jgi:hypothetical protein
MKKPIFIHFITLVVAAVILFAGYLFYSFDIEFDDYPDMVIGFPNKIGGIDILDTQGNKISVLHNAYIFRYSQVKNANKYLPLNYYGQTIDKIIEFPAHKFVDINDIDFCLDENKNSIKLENGASFEAASYTIQKDGIIYLKVSIDSPFGPTLHYSYHCENNTIVTLKKN